MIINSIDFIADEVKSPGFLQAGIYEDFNDAKAKMNVWLHDNDVEVINVETVVLPSLHCPHEEGSEDTAINVRSDFVTTYSQFVRLWFIEKG